MEIQSILIICNMVLTVIYPITKMFGRVKHSECLGAKMDMETPPPVKHGK